MWSARDSQTTISAPTPLATRLPPPAFPPPHHGPKNNNRKKRQWATSMAEITSEYLNFYRDIRPVWPRPAPPYPLFLPAVVKGGRGASFI